MWKDCSRVQCSTIEDRSTAQEEGLAQCMLWWWRNLLQAIYLLLFCFIAFHRLLASRITILYWQVLRHLDSATRTSVPWFVHVLEASFFGAANIKDSGVVGLHNGTSPHDRFPVDLGSPATMTNVTASGVLFHNCTTPHKGFRVDPSTSANNWWQIIHTNCWSALPNNMFFDDVCATDALNFHKRRH